MTNDHFDLPDAPQKTVHEVTTSEVYGRTYHHYRGYNIHFAYPPVPYRGWDWHYQHDDCDLDDDRHGDCATLEDCLAEIDDYIEEHEDESQGE